MKETQKWGVSLYTLRPLTLMSSWNSVDDLLISKGTDTLKKNYFFLEKKGGTDIIIYKASFSTFFCYSFSYFLKPEFLIGIQSTSWYLASPHRAAAADFCIIFSPLSLYAVSIAIGGDAL